MKAVFMGTPLFAAAALQKMIDMDLDIAAVVTQPDKTKGRGRKLIFSPVKELALEHNIPVLQPVRVRRDEEFKKKLAAIAPDVIVVVAFGQIIPQDILDIPKFGCINVHASLLPALRGAAPIQWSIINGDRVTGVTTMQMDAGLDTGDILLQEKVEISGQDTGGTLTQKLALAGGPLLEKTLKGLEQGTLTPVPQDDAKTGMYAKMLTKEMGRIDFSRSAGQIDCLIRGLDPWPSAYGFWNGKLLKIWKCQVLEENTDAAPGTVTAIDKKSFTVQTGQGCLRILDVQLEGRKRMDAGSFLRGNHMQAGQSFQ